MPESTFEPTVVSHEPQDCAVIRERVAMGDLTSFFARAFELSASAAAGQGRRIVGPPLAVYFGMPGETIDVAAGFPVDAAITADGSVAPHTLPGGRAVEALHVGPYDTLAQTYERMAEWMQAHSVTPADVMWESYLNEPREDDPGSAQTLITWPIT